MGKPKSSKTKLAHGGLKTKRNRVLPTAQSVRADAEFGTTAHKRNLAWNNGIDLLHNATIVGWAVRLDLAYTANFRFQANTTNEAFNSVFERHVYERSLPARWDACRRLSFPGMLRSFAMLKAVHGDALVAKAQAGRLQLWEAWQIAKGKNAPEEVNSNGLIINPQTGATDFYAIATGDSSNELIHQYLVPWEDAIYQMSEVLPIRPTQTRGESPLLVAMDLLRDQLDNRNYRLLRSKIEAMFGIVIKRDHNSKSGEEFAYNQADKTPLPDDPSKAVRPPLEFDLKPGLKLELDREDDAKFLESNTPGATWLEFDKNISAHILSAFDIPYTAFDGTAANYSSMRADMNRYKSSIEHRREQNAQAGHEMLEWALRADVASGALMLPTGMTVDDLDWELVPRATFVLDAGKEVDAIIKRLSIGSMTYAEAAKELGSLHSFAENVEAQSQEIKRATALGVSLSRGVTPGAPETIDPFSDNKQ